MDSANRVSSSDILHKKFHAGFRGYDRAEVDAFLDRVRETAESLERELADLREFRQHQEQHLQELREKEASVQNTMAVTQQLIDELKEGARKEAALIMKDADIRRQHIISTAQSEKAKLLGEIQDLKRKKHHFLLDMKKVVDMHREMISFEESEEQSHGTSAE